MTPTKIICSNCGFATNEDVGEDGITTKVGRCCENLPRPYEYDSSTETYSRPVGHMITAVGHEETDEEHDECNCEDCTFGHRWDACELDPNELLHAGDLRYYIRYVREQLGEGEYLSALESALESRTS